MSSRKFAATYPGTCPACDERIDIDDDLMIDDGRAVHFECAGERVTIKPREICPRCFTEKAVNGACAWCEGDS